MQHLSGSTNEAMFHCCGVLSKVRMKEAGDVIKFPERLLALSRSVGPALLSSRRLNAARSRQLLFGKQ